MNNYAIYTAVCGNYDNIVQPAAIDARFDYILFSDTITDRQIGVWQVRPIPYKNDNLTVVARWCKTHPEELLPEYDFSVWMDANLHILTPFLYQRTHELYSQQVLISSMWHHLRDNVYDEAIEILTAKLDHEKRVYPWIFQLKREKFPFQKTLYETNIVYRRHSHPSIKEIDSMWWAYISQHTKRDQLSFPYVLWKSGIDCPYLLPTGTNTSNSEHFSREVHTRRNYEIVPSRNESPILNYVSKICQSEADTYAKMYSIHRRIVYSNHPEAYYTFYCIYYRLLYMVKKTPPTSFCL